MSASRSTTSQLSADSITNDEPDALGDALSQEELHDIVDTLLREIDQHAGHHETAGDAA